MDEKNVEAIVKMGEVEKYSEEYFRLHGKQGLKTKIERYGKKGLSEIAKRAWITKRNRKEQGLYEK